MKQAMPVAGLLFLAAGCSTTPEGPGPGTCSLTITSEPPMAFIQVSEERGGPWELYRKTEGLHVTPSESVLKPGQFFWVMARMEEHGDSEPQFVRAAPGSTVELNFALEPLEETAVVYVNSDPDGGTVLVAESLDGEYQPWSQAEGEPLTPARGNVTVGDTFWVKISRDNYNDSRAEYVQVNSTGRVNLSFDLKKLDQPATAAKEFLSITSEPAGATVLVAGEKHGHYDPWPSVQQLQSTPIEIMVDAGQSFWLKLRKDGYTTSAPRLLQVEKGTPATLHLVLESSETQPAQAAASEPLEDLGMVWIPAGSFTMGSPLSEEGRFDDERQHRVTLSKGFWLGEYEVTQGQWMVVMGSNPSHFKGDNLPVERVSWEDCQSFLKRLNALGDGGFRLPTEAEWEYACRAGSTTRFCFGDSASELGDYAWYDKNSSSRTHPVGQKKPNAWGLYDMHGNVWEWCQDCEDDYPSGSVTDPLGTGSGSAVVDRGGCWDNDERWARSANHCAGPPDYRVSHVGFRLAR